MDIYGATNLVWVSTFPFTETLINKKAKGLFLDNQSGANIGTTIKLYAIGGGTISVNIFVPIGTTLILPVKVYSVTGGSYVSVYEIY